MKFLTFSKFPSHRSPDNVRFELTKDEGKNETDEVGITSYKCQDTRHYKHQHG